MSFVHPSLIALPMLALIAVPIVIHLINLLRHRRVRFAAMEFLLASQKRNRNSVRIKQLLLILARMATVAAVLLLLSQWVLTGAWARIFGGSSTHHLVLIDDSFSMEAVSDGATAIERGRRAVERIVGQAAQQPAGKRVTLLPLGKAAHRVWDAQQDPIKLHLADREGAGPQLESAIARLEASHLATATIDALEGVESLLADELDDRVLHIVSDFRARQWQGNRALRERLERLVESGVQLHLVSCTRGGEPNLAITELRCEPGVRASGVPLLMSITVRNFGAAKVEDAVATIETLDRSAIADESPGDWLRLPAVRFDEIAPGQSATQRFQVRFTTAGQHQVRATLDGDFLQRHDALPLDNRREAIVEVALDVPVLVIEAPRRGRAGRGDAFFVTTVLAPGGAVRTGLRPVVQPPEFLREQPIDGFDTIFLLDVERLDQAAIDRLESFVEGGGGVVFFTGPNTHRGFVNDQLYRDGAGLFPLPLLGPAELPSLDDAVDLSVEPAGIMRRLAGELYQQVPLRVQRYFAAAPGWSPPQDGSVQVAVRLRNDAPLIVERTFGRGRVAAVLTTAGREWTDWPAAITYPILIQELQANLSATRHVAAGRQTGARLTQTLDADQFDPATRVAIHTPHPAGSPLRTIERVAEPGDDGRLTVAIGQSFPETARAGTYRWELTNRSGERSRRYSVLNVAADEGDLRTLDRRELAAEMDGIDFVYHEPGDFAGPPTAVAGFHTAPYVLILLIVLLLAEQALARSASYHPTSTTTKP